MTLVASARSVPGTLRQEVTVGGRFRLETDEPVHLGGDDTAPAPHELLPAALAACASTTLTMYARTKGWELGQVAVDVVYDPKSVPRSCEITVTVDGPLGDDQLARLEQIAGKCPVQRALEAGIVFTDRVERAVPAGGLLSA